jgi:hypothetical protein
MFSTPARKASGGPRTPLPYTPSRAYTPRPLRAVPGGGGGCPLDSHFDMARALRRGVAHAREALGVLARTRSDALEAGDGGAGEDCRPGAGGDNRPGAGAGAGGSTAAGGTSAAAAVASAASSSSVSPTLTAVVDACAELADIGGAALERYQQLVRSLDSLAAENAAQPAARRGEVGALPQTIDACHEEIRCVATRMRAHFFFFFFFFFFVLCPCLPLLAVAPFPFPHL